MNEPDDLVPTRQSLLTRLKDWNDQESWRVFFETYWKLIYSAAVKAGLTDAEAQDVVQETVIAVSKSMPGFEYNSLKGSFKSWLLQLTRWRIGDVIRKQRMSRISSLEPHDHTSTRTATADKVPDLADPSVEAHWDEEWERNLMEAAIARVKRKVDPKRYQVFDYYVLKGCPVAQVMRAFNVNRAYVYMTKHRVSGLIKKEILHLQRKPI